MSTPERKFLHDLASPLAVVDARTRSLLRKSEAGEFAQDPQALLQGLKKLVENVEKLSAILIARRQEVIAQEKAAGNDTPGAPGTG